MKVSETVWRGSKKWLSKGLLVVGTSLLLAACGMGQQSIGKSIDLEFIGYDGEGTVSYADFNFYKEVYEVSLRQVGLSKNEAEAVAEGDPVVIARLSADTKQAAKLTQAQTLASSVTYELSQESGLSNGDMVVLTIRTSSKESPVKDEVVEFKVKGLKEYEVLKIKELLKEDKVRITGFEGYGQLKVGENSYSEIFDIEDESINLKNGDEVTLKLKEDYLLTLKAEGKTVDETTTSIEVEGLQPLTSIVNLADVLAKNDTYAKSEYENSSYRSYTLERQKDFIRYDYGYDESSSGQITLVTVYKVTEKSSSETEVYYTYVGYQAYVKKDNSLDLETANKIGSSWNSSKDYENMLASLETDGYKEYLAKSAE